VADGTFRQDLFLSVERISGAGAAARERAGDVALLVHYFV